MNTYAFSGVLESSQCLSLLKYPPSKHLVFEEPELDKQELGKLEVGKTGVDKQEVEFDLTSSEDDSWYFLGCS
nr:hypothetical protein [Tanacetum cinerariifolium]